MRYPSVSVPGSVLLLLLAALFLVVPIVAQAQDLTASPPKAKKALPKLEPRLQALLEGGGDGATQPWAQGVLLPTPGSKGYLRVILRPEGGDPQRIDRVRLRRLGGVIEAESSRFLRVRVPRERLREVAEQVAGIAWISLPTPKRPLQAMIDNGAYLTGALEFHEKGIAGQGVKVAIIDVGFGGLRSTMATGKIPAEAIDPSCTKNYVTGRSGVAAVETPGETHGTHVAYIVHAMAPEAQLCLSVISDEVDLENAVDDAIAQGVRIINHSLGWFNTGGFYDGTGIIDQIVKEATQEGVLWVNAAGNAAEVHWQGVFTDGDGDGLLDFAPGDECNGFRVQAGDQVDVVMNWDAYPSDPQDYDLLVYAIGPDGTLSPTPIAASEGPQQGSQPPEEAVSFIATRTGTYCFAVRSYEAIPLELEVFVLCSCRTLLEHRVAESSLPDPANSPEALAVGAVSAYLWTRGPQEGFSSQGPSNRSKWAEPRLKPDLVGPDGTLSFDDTLFYGTSASAPYVVGCAALLFAVRTDLSATEIRSRLETEAVDMGLPGKDNVFGEGRLRCRPRETDLSELTDTSSDPAPIVAFSDIVEWIPARQIVRPGIFCAKILVFRNRRGEPTGDLLLQEVRLTGSGWGPEAEVRQGPGRLLRDGGLLVVRIFDYSCRGEDLSVEIQFGDKFVVSASSPPNELEPVFNSSPAKRQPSQPIAVRLYKGSLSVRTFTPVRKLVAQLFSLQGKELLTLQSRGRLKSLTTHLPQTWANGVYLMLLTVEYPDGTRSRELRKLVLIR